ncbi:GNAT family N-acetyltransferase [Streptomyces sp. B21-083]|uniref:GNAT family N-acetyltransferase n=1 Tax=Streptomyces sp. B21-083 TaxID=3039410 RepID=UPI002FF26052
MGETLQDILDAVARGVFPPPDGRTTIVPQASHRDAGVLAFTAHAVVFTDEDPDWVRRTLAGVNSDALSAPMNPRFLTALMDRTGRSNETIDLLAVAAPLQGDPPLTLTEFDDPGHHRIARAHKHRDDVRVWAADGGLLILGRGVSGRLEAAVEVPEAVRHRGLGRALASSARHLSDGEPVWAQLAPGNARSVRAFQAAGFVPVGGEALLLAP